MYTSFKFFLFFSILWPFKLPQKIKSDPISQVDCFFHPLLLNVGPSSGLSLSLSPLSPPIGYFDLCSND